MAWVVISYRYVLYKVYNLSWFPARIGSLFLVFLGQRFMFIYFVNRKQKVKQFYKGEVEDRAHVRNSKLVKGTIPSQQRSQRQQPQHSHLLKVDKKNC